MAQAFDWDAALGEPQPRRDFDWDAATGGDDYKPIGALHAGLLGAYDGATFGWGDEIAGVFNEDWKRDLRRGYGRAWDEQGLAFMGGQLAGSLAPFGVGGLAARAATRATGAAARGLTSASLGLGGRAAAGASLGAAGGAIGGAGRTDREGAADRVMGGLGGAAFGAAVGGAFPIAMSGLGRVFGGVPGMSAAGDTFHRVFGGGRGPRPPSPEGGRPPPMEIDAIDDFIRTMGRGPQDTRTAAGLREYVNAALADPGRGRMMVDALGRAGTKRLRQLSTQPGQTADLAEAAFRDRASGASERLTRMLAPEADDAVAHLTTSLQDISERVLAPVLQAGNRQRAALSLDALRRRPSVDKALSDAEDLVRESIEAGWAPVQAASDPVYLLDALKRVIGGGIKDPTRLPRGLRSTQNAQLVSAYNAIEEALEDAAPGYRGAMDEMALLMQPLEMSRLIQRAQRTDRSNIGGNLMSDQSARRILVDPRTELMADVARAARTEDELFRSGSRVLTGSDTAANIGETLSQATAASSAPSIGGAANAAWRRTFGEVLQEVFGETAEDRANHLGRLLLQRVDDPNPTVRDQARRILDQIEWRMWQREAMSRNATSLQFKGHGGMGGYDLDY